MEERLNTIVPLVMVVTIAAIAGGTSEMKTSERAYVSLPDGKSWTTSLIATNTFLFSEEGLFREDSSLYL